MIGCHSLGYRCAVIVTYTRIVPADINAGRADDPTSLRTPESVPMSDPLSEKRSSKENRLDAASPVGIHATPHSSGIITSTDVHPHVYCEN